MQFIKEKACKDFNNKFKTNVGKEHRTINVGIDLGTNSTKVIYQIVELAGAGEKNAFIFDFNNDIKNFPPCTLPSNVIIKDNKLYFGSEAWLQWTSADVKFTSFKMCIACFSKIIKCKKCNKLGVNSFLEGKCSYNEYEICADDIMLFYLAFVIGEVYRYLNSEYAGHYNLTFFYNISFPLNYLENENNRALFEWLAIYAEDLKDDIYQGLTLGEADNLLDKAYNKFKDFPKVEEDKKTFTVAETRAAMHSFRVSGSHDDGLYATVDIGAGTTDISFFRLGQAKGVEPLFSFYYDQSHNLGGDDFDSVIYRQVLTQFANRNYDSSKILNDIKVAKHSIHLNKTFSLKVYGIEWGLTTIKNICTENYEKLEKSFRETFSKAFKKEAATDRWEDVKVILIGGGAQFPMINETLRNMHLRGINDWRPSFPESQLPDNLDLSNPNISQYELKKNFLYFYTAHGLSYHIDDITEARFPNEVSAWKPRKFYMELPDVDDLYF